MTDLGGFLLVMGMGSLMLYFTRFELKLMDWIDTWGTGLGLILRVLIMLVGLCLYILGTIKETAEKHGAPPR